MEDSLALESPEGKSIYYTKFDQPGVWEVPIVGGDETKIIQDEPFSGYWGYFAVGPDGLYFIGDTGTPPKRQPGFKFYDFATRKITNHLRYGKGTVQWRARACPFLLTDTLFSTCNSTRRATP